jgi:hypothetical protein
VFPSRLTESPWFTAEVLPTKSGRGFRGCETSMAVTIPLYAEAAQ